MQPDGCAFLPGNSKVATLNETGQKKLILLCMHYTSNQFIKMNKFKFKFSVYGHLNSNGKTDNSIKVCAKKVIEGGEP